jgi:biotin operon repressor
MKNQAQPPLVPPGTTLSAAKSREATARSNFERVKEEAICNLGDDFADWALVESSPDQFTSNKLPLFVRAVTAARELLAAENDLKLADEAVVAVQEASTGATVADVKDVVGTILMAFQVGLEQLGSRMDSRMDEISGRVDDIAEQTRKSIQQDLVTTGRTIHQHVAKELQQHKAGQGAYSLAQMKEQGAECGVLRSSGPTFVVPQMKEAGYSAQQLKEVGYSAQQLKEGGYSIQQLKEGGYSIQQLKEGGYSAQQLQQEGYPVSDVGGVFGLKGQALHDIGYPASALTAYQHTSGWGSNGLGGPTWYSCCQCTNKSSKYCKGK